MRVLLLVLSSVISLSCVVYSQEPNQKGYGELLIEKSGSIGRYVVRLDLENTDLAEGIVEKTQFFLFEDVQKKTKKLIVSNAPQFNITYKKGKKWVGNQSEESSNTSPYDWLIETDFFEAVTCSIMKVGDSKCKTGYLLTTLERATILKEATVNGETIIDVQNTPKTRSQFVFSEKSDGLPIRASMRLAWSKVKNATIQSDDEKDYIVNLFENEATWKKQGDVFVPDSIDFSYINGDRTAIPQVLTKIKFTWLLKEKIDKFSNEDFLSNDINELVPTLFD
jgi:hypothetical protein